MFSNTLLALLTFRLKIHYRSILRRVNKLVRGITLAHKSLPRSHMSWPQGRSYILQHNYGVEHLLHYVDDFTLLVLLIPTFEIASFTTC